ncbi:hypothetical protein Gohar_000805, partial [Gossypium harknessii]|nr:hypothetical protein [Gossypium harknessii]
MEEYMGYQGYSIRRIMLESGEGEVAELIDESNRKWKQDLIESTFPVEIAERILCIPLAKEPHEDFPAWRGEPTGEFTVRSAYKLLQENETDPRAYALQTETRNFYKNLWLQNLPSKIKITIWRIAWNYIPTWVNLHYRRLLSQTICSGCGRAAETTNHIFRECPVATKVWEELSFSEILHEPYMDFLEWLTWVFEQNNPNNRRVFCCALWAIWGERNKRVHEKVSRSGKEIAGFVKRYISELKGIEEKVPKIIKEVRKWKYPPGQFVKINFDAAFDANARQSAVGIVARDSERNALLSITELHHQVASAFAAEAIACRTATQIGMNMQWPNIIIEGDALSTIKKCKTQANDKSRVGAYIRDIHQLLTKTKRHYFEHTPREAN